MFKSTVRALVRNRGSIGIFEWKYIGIETPVESPTHDQAVEAFIAQHGDTMEFNAILQPGDKYF